MVKHRIYSRKRSQRRNRRGSRKMRGGVGQEDVAILQQLGFNEENIEYLLQTHPDMDIVFLQNSINGVPNSIFFPNPQTPDQIITALQSIDADIDNVDDSLNTTREAISQYSNNSLNNSGFSNISSIDGDNSDNTMNISDISFSSDEGLNLSNNTTTSHDESMGGKRRTLTKKNKRKTVAKKNKSKKTRKHRKKRQRGGNGFTTTLSTPLEENKNNYDTYVRLGLREY